MSIKTVDLVYFNAGGGHRAAALALQSVITEQGRPWQVRLVNLMEVLDPQGQFRKLTGAAPEDFYNQRLARGWTLGMRQELKLLQGMIRLTHSGLMRRLQQHWLGVGQVEPDLVVSLVPNFNRALCESVQSALPGVPFVTVMTDIADLPPHFWIEPGPLSTQAGQQQPWQRQHLVCGSHRAVEQALAAGHAPECITQASGMILRPDFYRPLPSDRAGERIALGLDPQRPTGVLMFGGVGSVQMARISRALADVQLIVLCGRNEALAQRIRDQTGVAPRAVLGFTHEVCRYLALGDFFIGKPGPGSLSEAIHMGLPVITFDNAWTMPQERYNTRWIQQQQLGMVLRAQRDLAAALPALIEQLPAFRQRVAEVHNRAVFEVVDTFERLMQGAEALGLPTRAGQPPTFEASAPTSADISL
jgi:UDP-N-acetylglucosamine:LPS N-acetylglucosamine transferase